MCFKGKSFKILQLNLITLFILNHIIVIIIWILDLISFWFWENLQLPNKPMTGHRENLRLTNKPITGHFYKQTDDRSFLCHLPFSFLC